MWGWTLFDRILPGTQKTQFSPSTTQISHGGSAVISALERWRLESHQCPFWSPIEGVVREPGLLETMFIVCLLVLFI